MDETSRDALTKPVTAKIVTGSGEEVLYLTADEWWWNSQTGAMELSPAARARIEATVIARAAST